MSDLAQELDEKIVDLIRNPIRERLERPDEIELASVTIDIIRNLNEAGYEIVKRHMTTSTRVAPAPGDGHAQSSFQAAPNTTPYVAATQRGS